MAPLSPPADPARALIEAARKQVGVTVLYDSAYVRLAYPGGDVPLERGVCADVIVRAYRRLGVDLQVLVHEDMLAAWTEYPKRWGLSHPDANIDHRRVPNLATFFFRHGKVLKASRKPADYAPGDIVTWTLPGGLPHIGIVTDQRSESGVPLVIHNVGEGARGVGQWRRRQHEPKQQQRRQVHAALPHPWRRPAPPARPLGRLPPRALARRAGASSILR